MNAQSDTPAGSAIVPHGRIADAIRDSIIAALLGGAASLCAMCVCAMCAVNLCFALNHASGISAGNAMGFAIYVAALANMWNAIGSLVGWLVFLFPVAMLRGRRPIADRMIPMCLAGALVGVILTGLECRPFSGWPFQPLGWIFVPFGVIDAVVATATLIHLRRKSSRQKNEGD